MPHESIEKQNTNSDQIPKNKGKIVQNKNGVSCYTTHTTILINKNVSNFQVKQSQMYQKCNISSPIFSKNLLSQHRTPTHRRTFISRGAQPLSAAPGGSSSRSETHSMSTAERGRKTRVSNKNCNTVMTTIRTVWHLCSIAFIQANVACMNAAYSL